MRTIKSLLLLLSGCHLMMQLDAAQPLFGVGYHTDTYSNSVLYRIDDYPNSPKAVVIGNTGRVLEDVAVDPSTQRIYAVSGFTLCEINPSNAVVLWSTNISIATNYPGLTFDRGGQLWAWGGEGTNSGLYKINKGSGVATLVGISGITSGAQGDLAFDTNGILYATTSNDFLITLNTNTGALGAFWRLTNYLGRTISNVWGLEIDTDGVMYAGRGQRFGTNFTGIAELYTINQTNGFATLIDVIAGADGFSLAGLSFFGNTNLPAQPTNSIYVAVEVAWKSEPNRLYQVQWRTKSDSGPWSNLGGWVLGNGSTNYVFDSTRGAESRFYRVQALQ